MRDEFLNEAPAEAAEEEAPERPKDWPFNPWRVPRSDNMRAVVEDVQNQLRRYEEHDGLRRRRRKPADQATFEATVSALVCDLTHHHLTGRDGGVFITRSNQVLGTRSRYRPPAYGKTLPTILDRLSTPEMSFLVQEEGGQNPFTGPRRTTIRAGERLVTRITDNDLTVRDIGIEKDQEFIVLKRPKAEDDYWDTGGYQEYEDNDTTRRFRRDMQAINGWLVAADLDVDNKIVLAGHTVDVGQRRLWRSFTQGRFDRGGRLFGGFWQEFRKADRCEAIFIGGVSVAELDYGQMNPRIVYGMCGVQPPPGDLYDIPVFEEHRGGIKKVMNAILFSTRRLTRMPKGTRDKFAAEHSIGQVLAAIEAKHPAITPRFFTGVGHEAQFVESQIIVDVLLRLKDQGIVALPIHDAVLVPSQAMGQAQQVMEDTFREHTGVDGVVTVE